MRSQPTNMNTLGQHVEKPWMTKRSSKQSFWSMTSQGWQCMSLKPSNMMRSMIAHFMLPEWPQAQHLEIPAAKVKKPPERGASWSNSSLHARMNFGRKTEPICSSKSCLRVTRNVEATPRKQRALVQEYAHHTRTTAGSFSL